MPSWAPAVERAPAWIPIGQHRDAFPGSTLLDDWDADTLAFYGRVREGQTTAAAEAELKASVAGAADPAPR